MSFLRRWGLRDMEWDKALAELLLREPEVRSWLGLDLGPRELPASVQAEALWLADVDRAPIPVGRAVRPAVAS
jgi:hypothetical protein